MVEDLISADVASPNAVTNRLSWWQVTRRLSTVLGTAGLIVLVLTTVAGIASPGNAWTDLLADLRMQQAIGLLLVLVFLSVAGRKWTGLIALTTLAVHIPWFSSAWDNSHRADGPADLTVMSANVLTLNRNFDSIESAIQTADADVVAIVELGRDLAERLETLPEYPYRHPVVQDPGNFGLGIYSKYPLSNRQILPMNLSGVVTLAADVSTDRGDYRLVATHPVPPLGRAAHQGRNVHLELLANWINEQQAAGSPPIILVGDFNLAPWTPTFDRFEQTTGLHRVARGFGVTPTWYAWRGFPFGLVIDHGMVNPDLRTVAYSVGPEIGSDHRPILFTLKDNRR